MSKRNEIPIIKSGKDLCRLVFTQTDGGRFEVKIDFHDKAFQVQTYRLFSQRPIVWNIDDPQHDMSYHSGKDDKPILIHIKNKIAGEGEMKYTTLPVTRIQPPNVTHKFPLPLMKIEVPDIVVDQADAFVKKNKHKEIDLKNANVLELYMLPEGMLNDNVMNKYPSISAIYLVASIEYFATNSVATDCQKSRYFMPAGTVATRGIGQINLSGMALYANVFTDPTMKKWTKKELL